MRKELKEKMINHGYCLYNKEWVEETATRGFNNVMEGMREKEPKIASAMEKVLWTYEIMYYTAFEDALNTFFSECLEDDVTKVELCLDKLHKITALIKTKSKYIVRSVTKIDKDGGVKTYPVNREVNDIEDFRRQQKKDSDISVSLTYEKLD